MNQRTLTLTIEEARDGYPPLQVSQTVELPKRGGQISQSGIGQAVINLNLELSAMFRNGVHIKQHAEVLGRIEQARKDSNPHEDTCIDDVLKRSLPQFYENCASLGFNLEDRDTFDKIDEVVRMCFLIGSFHAMRLASLAINTNDQEWLETLWAEQCEIRQHCVSAEQRAQDDRDGQDEGQEGSEP